jgi:hypothetical protein
LIPEFFAGGEFSTVRMPCIFLLAGLLVRLWLARKQILSISDVARMGAQAQLKKYGKRQLRAWGKLGGRPRKVKKS